MPRRKLSQARLEIELAKIQVESQFWATRHYTLFAVCVAFVGIFFGYLTVLLSIHQLTVSASGPVVVGVVLGLAGAFVSLWRAYSSENDLLSDLETLEKEIG